MRRSLLVGLVVLVASSAAATPPGEGFRRDARKAPTLTVADDEGRAALALDSLVVRAIVRGHLARTVFELTYRNDLDRVVGGDFVFPLPADAEVSDLGLYFDGKLRHGVAVERVQARNAYEQIVHRRADPALAEWNSGRSFRLSIYPINPQGKKSVVIAYDQELTAQPYVLDLRWGTAIDRVEVIVDAETQRVDAEGLDLRRDGATFRARAEKTKLDAVVTIARNAGDETALTAYSPEDRMWYASAPVRVGGDAPLLAPASNLLLLWDVSGSAARRDDRRAIDFIRTLHAGRITVVPFHIAMDTPREIDAAALEPAIAALPTAGATNLAAVMERLPALAATLPADARIAIVTDGIASIGDDAQLARAAAALTSLRRPIMVVNASPSPNDHLLGAIARATGGWYLDLTSIAPERALELARHAPSRLTIDSAWLPIRDVVPSAILTSAETAVTLSARSRDRLGEMLVGIAGGRRLLTVRDAALPDEASDLIRRAWARAKLRELLDAGASAAAVLEHGQRYNQLTPQTSLLVLETWQDYERYNVPMPRDVRAEKEAEEKAAAQWQQRWAPVQRESTIEPGGTSSEPPPDGAAWFIRGTVRDPSGSELPGVTVTLVAGDERKVTITEEHGRYRLALAQRPASFRLIVQLSGFGSVDRTFDHGAASGTIFDVTLSTAVAETITVTASSPALGDASSMVSADVPRVEPTKEALADRLVASLAGDSQPFIEDEELAAQAAAKRHATINQIVDKLRSFSGIADQLRYYTAARSVLGGDKWFHANAAVAMHDADAALGVRLLTDLIEAYPNDAPLLRIVGRILAGWGEPALARLMFERALVIAPDEEQTERELSLLAAGTAQPGSAQLQVEAMWDTNFSDVDLHVIEPGGEEVYYSHLASAKGGTLDEDIRDGYGPETYTIARASAGDYKVELHYYGADLASVGAETLAHVITWEYGRRRDHVVVLGGEKDRVTVVTLRGK